MSNRRIAEMLFNIATILDLAQDSVRRQVLFASLPHGKCLTVERLVARQALTVESLVQGRLSVINDGYFGDFPDLRGQRRLFWDGGVQVCHGYASDTDSADTTIALAPSCWAPFGLQNGLRRAANANQNALHFALLKAGRSMAARMAMIAITTSNSIKVKARPSCEHRERPKRARVCLNIFISNPVRCQSGL